MNHVTDTTAVFKPNPKLCFNYFATELILNNDKPGILR